MAAVGLGWVLHDAANAATARASGLAPQRLLDAAGVAQGPQDWTGAGEAAPGDAGLLLFTSGSTGNPKGVLLSHRGLANMRAACWRTPD